MLILDEPANGLDPPGIRWMRDLLRAHAARGRAVLVSSHLLSEVAQSVDDVVVIARGALRASGPLERVLGGGGQTVTRVRAADPAALAARPARAWRHGAARRRRGAAGCPAPSPRWSGALAAEHRLALVELGAVSRSLEDAFFTLTEDRPA